MLTAIRYRLKPIRTTQDTLSKLTKFILQQNSLNFNKNHLESLTGSQFALMKKYSIEDNKCSHNCISPCLSHSLNSLFTSFLIDNANDATIKHKKCKNKENNYSNFKSVYGCKLCKINDYGDGRC